MAHSANYLPVFICMSNEELDFSKRHWKRWMRHDANTRLLYSLYCYITPTIVTGKFRSHLICFSILKETLLHCRAEALTENINVLKIDLNLGRY